MNDQELAGVVGEIGEVLRASGYEDRADWMALRERALNSGDADTAAYTRTELHGTVHGMGGLLDLDPPDAQRRRLDALTERLWLATNG